jgi:hypothetical protein
MIFMPQRQQNFPGLNPAVLRSKSLRRKLAPQYCKYACFQFEQRQKIGDCIADKYRFPQLLDWITEDQA